eukprot:m.246156 g.246156  ORF g.246156 m.246156 type:complete len:91 (-) comp19061_c1_seq2:316-588(-)
MAEAVPADVRSYTLQATFDSLKFGLFTVITADAIKQKIRDKIFKRVPPGFDQVILSLLAAYADQLRYYVEGADALQHLDNVLHPQASLTM